MFELFQPFPCTARANSLHDEQAGTARRFDRRGFVTTGGFLLLSLGQFRPAAAGEPAVRKATWTYKHAGPLKIKADAFWNDGSPAQPVVVWIHGGALMVGHREALPKRIREMTLAAGCALVSIDYRLAPETMLPGIIQDLEDAFHFLRKQGAGMAPMDPTRLAVMGASAGGYLTLVAGYRVSPPPRALVSFFGYGDLVGDWYSKPSHHPRHNQVKLTQEEAWRQVSGPPISDSRDRQGDAGAFYQYCRQNGLWPRAVSGWDPHTQSEKFSPYLPVRHVTRHYPPTLLIHGTQDTDVPYEQSVLMARQLEQHGVPHRLLTVEGAEHGLAGAPAKVVDDAYQQAMAFACRYLVCDSAVAP